MVINAGFVIAVVVLVLCVVFAAFAMTGFMVVNTLLILVLIGALAVARMLYRCT